MGVTKLRKELEKLSRSYPKYISDKIEIGLQIYKGYIGGIGEITYLIDSLVDRCGIVNEVKEKGRKNKLPYGKIFEYFTSSEDQLLKEEIEKGNSTIPFSLLLKERAGSCLERSILTNLTLSENRSIKTFIISKGYLVDDEGMIISKGETFEQHAFVIYFKDDIAKLVDSARPFIRDNKLEPNVIELNDDNIEFKKYKITILRSDDYNYIIPRKY